MKPLIILALFFSCHSYLVAQNYLPQSAYSIDSSKRMAVVKIDKAATYDIVTKFSKKRENSKWLKVTFRFVGADNMTINLDKVFNSDTITFEATQPGVLKVIYKTGIFCINAKKLPKQDEEDTLPIYAGGFIPSVANHVVASLSGEDHILTTRPGVRVETTNSGSATTAIVVR